MSRFLERLERVAARYPEKPAARFLADGETETDTLLYRELRQRVEELGRRLVSAGASSEPVLLLLPYGLDFVVGFLACLSAGAIAIPAAPATGSRRSERLCKIVEDGSPKLVLTVAALEPSLARWGLALPTLLADVSGRQGAGEVGLPHVPDEAPAFLQYTSGSTSSPKGVVVSHANLEANERLIQRAFGLDSSSVVVGWLPLYHDMGLVGNLLQPLSLGASCVLMPPSAFLQAPSRWLRAIDRYRGTTSGGPNFAFDLCCDRVDTSRETLDLSSWTLAYNGSEPIRRATLERFAQHFEPWGFDRRAIYCCYGLAEATLMVSGGFDEPGRATDEVTPSSGRVAEGAEVLVVDPETRKVVPEGAVGEVWVAGASVAQGYWGRPEESSAVFGARLEGAPALGPFLRTGDLGRLVGAELTLTGRLKDLLIVRGQNHYPQDLELTAEKAHTACRAYGGAAFSVEIGGEECLTLVQEVDRRFKGGWETVGDALRAAFAREHQLALRRLVLVPVGGVPRTTSGKVRRRDCRQRWQAGKLVVLWEGTWGPTSEALASSDPEDRKTSDLERELANWVGRLGGLTGTEGDGLGLGLDSLGVAELHRVLAREFGAEIAVERLFEIEGLAVLAEEVRRAAGAGVSVPRGQEMLALDVPTGSNPTAFPATLGQTGLLFRSRFDPTSTAERLAVAVELPKNVTPARVVKAWAQLVARHCLLGARLVWGGEVLIWRCGEGLPLEVVEVQGAAASTPWTSWLERDLGSPMELEAGKLALARLAVAPAAGGSALLLVLHHSLADFRSLGVLARELAALLAGATLDPSSSLSFAAVSALHQTWLKSDAALQDEKFWLDELVGLPRLELPLDRPGSGLRNDLEGRSVFAMSPGETERLKAIAAAAGITLPMLLLAGLEVVLARAAGQEDFAVGFLSESRDADTRETFGYLANPLVLRSDYAGGRTVADLLALVKRRLLGALRHQRTPYPRLKERVAGGPEGELFEVLLNVLRTGPETRDLVDVALGLPGASLAWQGVVLGAVPLPSGHAQRLLTLNVGEGSAGLCLTASFDSSRLDAVTVERWLELWRQSLFGMEQTPSASLARFDLIGPALRSELTVLGQGPPCQEERSVLHELVWRAAARLGEAPALVSKGETWSFRELVGHSERVASGLLARGVGLEDPIAVLLPREPRLIAALLGIMAAGACYVPLDPAYPEARWRQVLDDSGARFVITEASWLISVGPGSASVVDFTSLAEASPRLSLPTVHTENLAYLIYTSGSTGRPKGVAIRHRSAVARCRWAEAVFSPGERAGVLASTSVGFDLSIFEIFATLATGGTVILAQDALELPTHPRRSAVTLLNTVPSAAAALVESDGLPKGIGTICLAGEALPPRLVPLLLGSEGGRRLWNLYGPSEDTTYSTGTLLTARDAASSVPIGKPLPGTRAYLVDRFGELVPRGSIGEVCLAGVGVARGYWRQPALTAERFLPDTFSLEAGARLFRVGDLARWRADGRLEFLGRGDHQVKIRGFRIELGEVEHVLAAVSELEEVAVLGTSGPGGDTELVAFVVLRPGRQADEASWRTGLSGRLPPAFQPSRFVTLAALPRTPNGKLDRRALAGLAVSTQAAERLDPPATPIERALASLWVETLGSAEPSRQDSFVGVGGHSLSALRFVALVAERLGLDLPIAWLMDGRTLAALAVDVGGRTLASGSVSLGSGAALEPNAPSPLSDGQRQLWFLHRLDSESPVYNVPVLIRLRGELDVPALGLALRRVVARHAPLRSIFTDRSGEPEQLALEPSERSQPRISSVDLSALEPGEAERCLQQSAARFARLPFDLQSEPGLRACLARLEVDRHALALSVHHIVFDGWSLEVLLSELAGAYRSERAGAGPADSPLSWTYADFVRWEAGFHDSEAGRAALEEQRKRLVGMVPLELATDWPRPARPSFRGGRVAVALPAGTAADLRALARRERVTLFSLLLAAWRWTLGREAGQADFGIAVPISQRRLPATHALIGFVSQLTILRRRLSPEQSFLETIAAEHRGLVAALHLGHVPLGEIASALGVGRDRGADGMVQVSFSLQPRPGQAAWGDLGVELESPDTGTAKFDLSLQLWEGGGGIEGFLEYRAEIFASVSMEARAQRFSRLLEEAFATPERPLRWLGCEPAPTRPVSPPTGRPVVERVLATAERDPARIALVDPERSLTLAELVSAAAELAVQLRASVTDGGAREPLVAILLPRGVDLVVAQLAVWLAGGAFLPLDPEAPPERLRLQLREVGAAALITSPALTAHVERLAPCPVLSVGRLTARAGWRAPAWQPPASPEQLAYAIFTSGSSGKPKASLLTHGGLAALVDWHVEAHCLTAGDRVSQLANPAFDAAVWEIWPALTVGAPLVFLPEACRTSSRALVESLASSAISQAFVPTPLAELLLLETWPRLAPPLTVMTGGDRLRSRPPADAPFRLVNHYGPTEATVVATAGWVGAEESGLLPSIGRPIRGQVGRVLDRFDGIAPSGVPGELWLGGSMLARGYHGQPGLTADRFRPDPWGAAGERLYRTGDLVRVNRSGDLEFLGRLDSQVKIRGLRIELGEIEALLAAQPEVREAVVEPQGSESARWLAGYVVKEGEVAEAELLARLARALPAYMVPSRLVFLERLPRTENDKLDRRALPVVEPASGAARISPRNDLEVTVASIWSEVLGNADFGVEDDFFALGGSSLQVARVASRLRDELDVEVPVADLFLHRTVAAITLRAVELLAEGESAEDLEALLAAVQAGSVAKGPV